MKKQFLIILLLSLGFIGTASAGEVETNILKLSRLNSCESCNLQGANLSGTDFSGANLGRANLSGADFSGANLSKADLSKANLRKADLSEADLNGANLRKADLSEADLNGANLRKADLSGGYLYGANLNGSNLNGANLSEANLNGVDLIEVDFTGATVSQKVLEEKIKRDEKKRIAEEKKDEEKRIAEEKKEQNKIDSYLRKLKNHSKKLKVLKFDFLKVEADELIKEVEKNTNSDLNVLKNLNQRLRDMNSSVELKIKTEERRLRKLSLKDYPGFKDLKPGLHYEDLTEFCPLRKNSWVKCYGIDNIKFQGKYQSNVLKELILDMGPIVEGGGFYLNIFGEDDSNIFIKMKKTFEKKYTLDYGYSERDRQLFNESEKDRLLHVYSKGQVVLEINRKKKDYSNDLWLFIHYFDPTSAKSFLERNRPVRASNDDF